MKRAWPIRWYLYLIVFATAAPLCLFIAAGLVHELRQAQEEGERLVLTLAANAGAFARGRLDEAEFFTRALAQRPLVKLVDPARCDPILDALLPLHPHYSNIVVLDLESRFVCSSLPLPAAGARALPHDGILGALQGRFAVSEPRLGTLVPRLLVSPAFPIVDSETIVGVLAIAVDLASLRPVDDPLALPRNAQVRVIDGKGFLLASSTVDDPDLGRNLRGTQVADLALANGTATLRALGTDGVLRLYGYTPVGAHGWRAYAGVPVDELFAATRQRILASALIATALLAAALLSAGLFARRLARHAAAIQRAMDERTRGRVVHARVEGSREMRALAENYNHMLDATLAAQDALHQSEGRLRLAVRASHTGLWDWDVTTDHVYYSPEWKRQLGFAEEEIADTLNEWTDRLHPDDRTRVVSEQRGLGDTGRTDYQAEFRLRHKDGTYRWIYSRAELIRDPDGSPRRMLGTHIDITPRKVLEQALQRTVEELRALSRRLIEVEEAERRNISRELHDRTGANVAALSITLGLIADKIAGGEAEAATVLVNDAREVLTQVSSEIRNVMSELRPAALDDFGLYPAFLSYARGVASRLGIQLTARGGPIEPRPPSAVETALFRIGQEALTNMAKHANAKAVEIDLQARDGAIVLSVSDDGIGVDLSHDGGHGMRTMRERADAIGARLTIDSKRGAGTRVSVEVPRS